MPVRTDALWQHTCCELFISWSNGAGYREFNFSPAGHWQHYSFERYREGRVLADDAAQPSVTARVGSEDAQFDVVVPVPPTPHRRAGRLRIGVSAIVEDDEGRLTYWALRHPAGKPDFHDPGSFILTL